MWYVFLLEYWLKRILLPAAHSYAPNLDKIWSLVNRRFGRLRVQPQQIPRQSNATVPLPYPHRVDFLFAFACFVRQ